MATITPNADANFTPTLSSYSGVKPFKAWVQMVLPQVYNDALSYQELVYKMLYYINTLIDDMDKGEADITALKEAYDSLESYVNEYFGSLDVQEEINNKLDEFANDGTLSSLIVPLVSALGSPVFVNSTSSMTDTSKLYVLNSTGYLYYYNGSNWINSGFNFTESNSSYIPVVGTMSYTADLDDYTQTGVYQLVSQSIGNYVNNPSTNWGMLQVIDAGANVYYQIKTERYQTWVRCNVNGWYDWELYSRDDNMLQAWGTDSTNLEAVESIDDLTTNGVYTVQQTHLSDCPVSSGWIINACKDSTHMIQIVFEANRTYGGIYYRYYLTNSGWSAWTHIDTVEPFQRHQAGIVSGGLADLEAGYYYISTTYEDEDNPIDLPLGGLLCIYTISHLRYYLYYPQAGGIYWKYWSTNNSWNDDWYYIKPIPDSYANTGNYEEYGFVYNDDGSITINTVESGYYHSVTGDLASASTYWRTKRLIPMRAGTEVLVEGIDTTMTNQAEYYDENLNYLGFKNTNTAVGDISNLRIDQPNAAYFGLNFKHDEDANFTPVTVHFTKRDIRKITADYDGYDVSRLPNRYINVSSGAFVTSTLYNTFTFIQPAFKYYATNLHSTNSIGCFDEYGNLLLTGSDYTEYDVFHTIRVYEIPENTYFMCICLGTTNNNYGCFIDEVPESSIRRFSNTLPVSHLSGKKVAAIGDSIVYIDNYTNSAGDYIIGWISALRERGAIVANYGYSGRAYADNSEGASIYDYIKECDFSEFDIAILAGGSNDLRLSSTIGDYNTDYKNPNVDTSTFIGAIGATVQFLREQNPNIELFITNITPSEDSSRAFEKHMKYNDAIEHCSKFWQIPLIDVYRCVNVHPHSSEFSSCFYDTTHTNTKGGARIGAKIVAAIENEYALY